MKKTGAKELLIQTGIAAVIRGATVENIVPISEALLEGGVRVLEITVETSGAYDAIKRAKRLCTDMSVGAGTVLDIQSAKKALDAGAEFVFSPIIIEEVVKFVKHHGALSIPGAYTPTEIYNAYFYGAGFVKVFPAVTLGPGYLKNM